MFSQEAKRNIVACRACWMCRHLCPVGLVTGSEDNTPRAKALLMNYAEEDEAFLKETAKDMYECALCNHCANWCETGYEPAVFIREGRRALVENGELPENIRTVVERIMEAGGGLYGVKRFSNTVQETIRDLPKQAEVLLILGDTAAARSEGMALAAINLFKKAEISFSVLRDEPSAGAALYDLVGELAEVQTAAKLLESKVRASGCNTLVILDPAEARILTQDYPRWGCEIPATVVTATAFVADLIRKKKLTVKSRYNKIVTFHDPCHLARDLSETQPARDLLKAVGAELEEMYLHGNNTRCCGGEVLAAHSHFITEKTAELRIEDALRTKAEEIVTACPGCLDVLGNGKPKLPVKDLFCILDQCC